MTTSITHSRMKIFLTAFVVLITLQLQGQTISYKTVDLKPYQSLQNYEHFKRLVLNSSEPSLEFLSGFDFEWGYNYKLKVKENKLDEVLSDGTQYDFYLVKVLEKTPVESDFTFRMVLDPQIYYSEYDMGPDGKPVLVEGGNRSLTPVDDHTWLYFEAVEIEVPEELLTQFTKLVEGKNPKRAYFSCVNSKRIRLERF